MNISINKVIAFDENGNKYEKDIKLYKDSTGKNVISFGWPCEYYIESLKRHYPFKKNLCIDITGRNHKNSSVYIHKNDLNEIFNELIK